MKNIRVVLFLEGPFPLTLVIKDLKLLLIKLVKDFNMRMSHK